MSNDFRHLSYDAFAGFATWLRSDLNEADAAIAATQNHPPLVVSTYGAFLDCRSPGSLQINRITNTALFVRNTGNFDLTAVSSQAYIMFSCEDIDVIFGVVELLKGLL